MSPKITEQHRSRPAYISVRQSTNAQVLHFRETGSAYAVVPRFTVFVDHQRRVVWEGDGAQSPSLDPIP